MHYLVPHQLHNLFDERFFSVLGQTLLQHHHPADLTLEVAVGVLGVCIILVIVLIVHRWRQARLTAGCHNQQLTVTRAINEANEYLSTDVGCYLVDNDSNKPVASDNIVQDMVALDNTLSETKA